MAKTRGEIDAENSALVEILSRPIPIRKIIVLLFCLS